MLLIWEHQSVKIPHGAQRRLAAGNGQQRGEGRRWRRGRRNDLLLTAGLTFSQNHRRFPILRRAKNGAGAAGVFRNSR
jgi:hypothetical protein